MDLDEWEVLSDDGFLDFKQEDSITKGFLSRELAFEFDPKGGHGVDVNYFICPSPRPPDRHQSRVLNRRDGVVPVPIQLEPTVVKAPCLELEKVKDISEVPVVEISILAPTVQEQIKEPPPAAAADQVFFKKMKENEFVDMKLDSPRSGSTNSRGPKPQIEAGSMPFEEKKAACDDGEHAEHRPSKMPIEEEDGGGLNIWKWRVSGIGALCSLGLAAATLCIFVFSGHQRYKQQGRNQKFHFEIYADDQVCNTPSQTHFQESPKFEIMLA
ncbi:hypothetical protein ACLOJK_021099 [Asimina triloba]